MPDRAMGQCRAGQEAWLPLPGSAGVMSPTGRGMPPEPCPAPGLGRGAWGHMCGGRPAGELWVPPGTGAWLPPRLGCGVIAVGTAGRARFSAGLGAAGQGKEPVGRLGTGAPARCQASSARHPVGGCSIQPGRGPHLCQVWQQKAPYVLRHVSACPVLLPACNPAARLICQHCSVRGTAW